MSATVDRPQQMVALDKANDVRARRRDLKCEIKDGIRSVVDLLADPPALISTMRLDVLLLSQPQFGHSRLTRLLRDAGRLSGSKTIGELTERQRLTVVRLLGGGQ